MHLVLKIIPKKWLIMIALSLLFLLGTILLGATMTLIGGMEGNKKQGDITYPQGGIGTANVPPEVLKWEPLVRKYAQEFGVEPYVPLMLSLIMQESGGRLLDVMQSAGATRFSISV
ncbi:lysozyme family protein [Bacillus mycoides]|uniref:lysozyme family protein n=1 Tax=Bacillus mycoides TaxID=1405 RepID=UPI003D03296E